MTYQLATAKIWDGSQWVPAAGGGAPKPWWQGIPTDVQNASASTGTAASANTKTAWIELVASTSGAANGIWLRPSTGATSSVNNSSLLDVGIGAAGNETVVLANIASGYSAGLSNAAGWPHNYLFFPVDIPVGSRIAIRHQSQVTTCSNTVKAWLVNDPNQVNTPIVDTLGADTSTTRGINISPSNTYVEVTPSTSVAYSAFVILLAASGTSVTTATRLVTLAVGASGSEVDKFSVSFYTGSQEAVCVETPFAMGVAAVPAGSRIALKTNSALSAIDYIVYGIRA